MIAALAFTVVYGLLGLGCAAIYDSAKLTKEYPSQLELVTVAVLWPVTLLFAAGLELWITVRRED